MKMINNYLNSFESYLSTDVRREIREELEASILEQIEDQEEQLSRPLNEQEQEELLLRIGHPMKVAAGFLPNQQLVSAEYFPAYKKVLTIALWIYGVITVLKTLPFSFNLLDGSVITTPIYILGSLIETSIWVFTCVTLAFYLLQHYAININFLYAWSPKQLSGATQNLPLSRVETAFEFLFIGLFLTWWNSLFGSDSIFVQTDVIKNITMSDSMQPLLWPVNVLSALYMMVSLYNLIHAGWSRYSLILNIILGLVGIVLLAFMLQVENYATIEFVESNSVIGDFVGYLDLNVRIVLGAIVGYMTWGVYSSFNKLKV